MLCTRHITERGRIVNISKVSAEFEKAFDSLGAVDGLLSHSITMYAYSVTLDRWSKLAVGGCLAWF
jgi:hypothetical protein